MSRGGAESTRKMDEGEWVSGVRRAGWMVVPTE